MEACGLLVIFVVIAPLAYRTKERLHDVVGTLFLRLCYLSLGIIEYSLAAVTVRYFAHL